MWNTISRGDASPRTEILLNIDNELPNGSGLGNFQGMALRMGSMKLLMNVPNITWFKPPELGGIFPEQVITNDVLTEETDEHILKELRQSYIVSPKSSVICTKSRHCLAGEHVIFTEMKRLLSE